MNNFGVYSSADVFASPVPSLTINADIVEQSDCVLVKQAQLISGCSEIKLNLNEPEVQRMIDISIGREFPNQDIIFGF